MTNDTQPPNTPGRSAALLPGVLLIIVLLMGLMMLMALGFKESPMLSAAFVIVLLTIVIGGAIAWVRDSRGRERARSEQLSNVHATVAQASAQAFAATTTALFEYLKQNQNQLAPPSYVPLLPEPARDQIVDVPKIMNMQQPVGVSGVRTKREGGQPDVVASVAGLAAALNILALGKDPTRSNFKEQGIASSAEVAGAVEFLAHHGYIEQRGQGSPAKWADSVSAVDVARIADHMRAYAPALPRYIMVDAPPFLDMTLPGAGRQATRQAGGGGGL